MTNLLGQSLGRYHILEQLGEGGMATVYKSYDTRLETDVAVKVIRTENLTIATMERALKRFEREAKALARLTHPNIVKVTDFGEYQGRPYLVMEYLPGGTLKQSLKERGGPMPWQEAARLLLPVTRALDFAHRQNMIHRDVKPSNILITADGEPMLTDFGIAKILDLEETQDLTGTGMGIGTPEYMAPEQWTGKASALSDQYALGVVFYEMVTGRKPYTADTPAAILLKQATEPLPRPSQFVRGLPERVEKLLLKALARNPEDRYSNMGEFAVALEAALSGIAAPAKPQPSRLREGMADAQAAVHPMGDSSAKGRGDRGGGGGTPASARIERASGDAAPKGERALPSPRIERGVGGESKRYWLLVLIGVVCLLGSATLASLGYTPIAALFPTNTPTPTSTPTPTNTPTRTPTPTPTPLPTEISAADPAGNPIFMRLVPAGEFPMGSENGDSDERPVHPVYLDAFYMDAYEVTNALYRACVDAGVCDPPHDTSSRTRSSYYGNSEFNDYPVINVDWNQAKTYCEWRGPSTGSGQARLPTEAEWEKAARGTDGRTYPWGEGIDCYKANYYDGNRYCVGDTTQVGSYENGKSPYGLYDMAGNVWEWVADWYSDTYYDQSPSRNPQGPSSGSSRVVRGGTWHNYGNLVRSADRNRYVPGFWNLSLGFRCAFSP